MVENLSSPPIFYIKELVRRIKSTCAILRILSKTCPFLLSK